MDIEDYEKDLNQNLDILRGCLKRLNHKKITDSERQEVFAKIGSDGQTFPPGNANMQNKSGILLEMADLLRGLRTAATDLESMNPQGAKAGRKMRNLKKKELKELVNQFRTIYINYGNKELMGPRKQEKAATNREIGTLAVSKAKENVEIMDSIVRDAHAAVDLNNDTLETLDKQTDQMVRIGQKVTQFQNDLRRANRLLDSFRRRMQSDKLIVCFMFLVVSGILFCIIYSAVDPASDEQLYLPDSAKPPSREQLEEDFGSGRRRMFRLP